MSDRKDINNNNNEPLLLAGFPSAGLQVYAEGHSRYIQAWPLMHWRSCRCSGMTQMPKGGEPGAPAALLSFLST